MVGKNRKNIFLRYILVSIFVSIIFYLRVSPSCTPIGDEQRYIDYANNLWNGFYSPDFPNIFIWNGPGYPIFLMPFIKIGFGIQSLRALNLILYIASLIILDRFLMNKVSYYLSNLILLFLVFYIPLYNEMTQVLTETLSFLLITLFVINMLKIKFNYVKVGIILGFIVLTKVIFGYILLILLLVYGLRTIKIKSSENLHIFKLLLVALLVNLPYLIYTYSLTKKPFYWANSGGVSLYWMSSPHDGEFGDWPSMEFSNKLMYDTRNSDSLHLKEINAIKKLPIYRQDEAYKSIAVSNIKGNPIKYLRNYIANFERLFFNMPNSYSKHREIMLWYFPFNILLFLGFLFIIFCFIWRRDVQYNLTFLTLLIIGYILTTCSVFTYTRFIEPVIPIILILTIEYLKISKSGLSRLLVSQEGK